MKVLISPSSFGQIDPQPIDLLLQNGFEVINNPYGRKLTEAEVITLGKDCIGIIAGLEPLNANVMDSLPALQCISRVGIGLDNVDMDHAALKNIAVCITPDAPSRSVAELTLALAMSWLRKIPSVDSKMKQKIWKKETGNLLLGKKVGIVGLGRIGKIVASLFLALGNEVMAYDKVIDKDWVAKYPVNIVDFDTILAEADIITLHIPGIKDKQYLIGTEELKKMKNTSLLINVARGGIVDETALFEALKNGIIAGACIDVYSEEPYTGNLCDLENVILTPHLGSYASESKLQMEIESVENFLNTVKQ